MDPAINGTVWGILVVLSALVIGGLLFVVWKVAAPPPEDPNKKNDGPPEKQGRRQRKRQADEEDEAVVQQPQERNGMGRMNARNRRRPVVEESSSEDMAIDHEDDGSQPEATPGVDQKVPEALGKKKLAKLQAKEERAKMREAMEQQKKEKNEREDREIYERKKKQAEEDAEEKRQEEELEKARKERERKEQEEYDAMKHLFSVEGDGSLLEHVNLFDQDTQGFCDYLKERKVVFLEDLSAKYHVKTQTIVDRINKLEAEGKLSGIIDERGKFIYVTQEEMAAVARFIKLKGRVSIAEIQRESNNLINLNPTIEEEKQELEEENK